MRSAFRRADLLFIALTAALVLLYVASGPGGFPLDDAWIHQTYARNLATTGEWAFVPGVPSAASTSPLYTVLLAIGYAFGVPHLLWTHGLGALSLALTAIIGSRMAERLSGSRRVGFAAGIALLLNWHLLWAAVSGMETMLFSLWTLVLIALGAREFDNGSRPYSGGFAFGIASALAYLTRPEGIVLAGLVAVALLLARAWDSWHVAIRWLVAAAVGFFLVTAPYLLYNLRLTGGLLPDTAAAKQAEYAVLLALPYSTRLASLLLPLAAGAQVLLLPGVLVYAARQIRDRNRKTLHRPMLVLWPLVLVALYAARLPANYQHGRYVIPALPAFVVAGVVGTAWLLGNRRRPVGRILSRALALSALVAGVTFALVIGPRAYATDVSVINEEMVASARWIAANVSPDELLAVHDIGAVGYFAPRPILDLAGLVSPEVVPVIRDADALWSLMEARDARYLMAFPDQIPGQNPVDPRLCSVFETAAPTASRLGQPSMAVYRVVWDSRCG